MKIRPLAAVLSMRRQDVTVGFRNFANAPKNGYDRECSTHDIANVPGYIMDHPTFRKANVRLIRYPTFTNQSMAKDPTVIQIINVCHSVSCFLNL